MWSLRRAQLQTKHQSLWCLRQGIWWDLESESSIVLRCWGIGRHVTGVTAASRFLTGRGCNCSSRNHSVEWSLVSKGDSKWHFKDVFLQTHLMCTWLLSQSWLLENTDQCPLVSKAVITSNYGTLCDTNKLWVKILLIGFLARLESKALLGVLLVTKGFEINDECSEMSDLIQAIRMQSGPLNLLFFLTFGQA